MKTAISLVLVVLTLALSVDGFSPQSARKIKLSTNHITNSKQPTHLNMLAPGAFLLPPAFKYIAAAPAMYGLMSVNEYVTHRYFQHAEFNKLAFFRFFNLKIGGGGHIEHHAETLDDMSLKTDERWLRTPAANSLNSDPYRGTGMNIIIL